MSTFFFFSFPKELSFKALDIIKKTANISLEKQNSDADLTLTLEDIAVLDQLKSIIPSDCEVSVDLGILFDYAVYRAYIYLQWLNILGLDVTLNLDEAAELLDIMGEYEKVQIELERRFREFSRKRELLN